MPEARRIRGSVGVNGVNRYDDVRLIQKLLNRARLRHEKYRAVIMEPVKVDGDCGDLTKNAILAYQSIVLGWTGDAVDGKISPDKATWKSLNGNVGGAHAPVGKTPPAKPLLEGYVMYRQGAYRTTTLGTGSLKISGYGCALCTLTMAATAIGTPTDHWPESLRPDALTPIDANTIITAAGGFHNSLLNMARAANALGMTYDEHGRHTRLRPSDVALIESALAAGRPVAAHVDYKASAVGDHWILIVKRNDDGTFVAVDPSTGRPVRLTRSPITTPATRRMQPNPLSVERGVLFGLGEGGSRDQQKYVVVRFGLLGPLVGGYSGQLE